MRMPWRRLAGFAMARLGWPPEVFWAATPVDLALALEALLERAGGAGAMDRAGLEALSRRFPDRSLDGRRRAAT